jgi:hypothetical protein
LPQPRAFGIELALQAFACNVGACIRVLAVCPTARVQSARVELGLKTTTLNAGPDQDFRELGQIFAIANPASTSRQLTRGMTAAAVAKEVFNWP